MFLVGVFFLEFNAQAMLSTLARHTGVSCRVAQAALSHSADRQTQMTDDELAQMKARVFRMKEGIYRLNKEADDLQKKIDRERKDLPYNNACVRVRLNCFGLRAAGFFGSIGGIVGVYDYIAEHGLSVPVVASFCALVCTTIGFSIATHDAYGMLSERVASNRSCRQNIKWDETTFNYTVKVLIAHIKELESIETRVQECEITRTIPALKTWFDMKKELSE